MSIHKIIIPTPFAVGDVNSYLLKGDALTLIDAGPKTPEAWEAIKAGLKVVNLRPQDITKLVLTHHYSDQASLVVGFENAKLIVTPYCVMRLRKDEVVYRYHDDFYPVRLNEE